MFSHQSAREVSTTLVAALHHCRDRIKLHCYYDVAIYEGIKECVGYTVLFLLNTTEEKSVGHTVFLHLSDGRKECGVHCSFPLDYYYGRLLVVGHTVFLHLSDW